nr:MAG TPA: hypothetical protein [Caudoviricetes sp.]
MAWPNLHKKSLLKFKILVDYYVNESYYIDSEGPVRVHAKGEKRK